MTNIIGELKKNGQSIWYDNIERKLLEDGTLAGMVERGEIRGITSNPSIFNNAISNSSDYDQEIESLTKEGLSREDVYEQLAVRDIQRAADMFLPLYQETNGGDGYVSLEVSPFMAHETEKTIQDAKKLWKMVNRPNLMIKIPATIEGLPAITEVIAAGINVNVTLIFSITRYQAVMDAYLTGLEKRIREGKEIGGIASVASFFISRIDAKVDNQLTDLLPKASDIEQKIINNLFGKAALASGKLAFDAYEEIFGEEASRFTALVKSGANKQRALWASTSTKNPQYPDTMYVDELIGPDTVNTVPPKTLVAFFDHGTVERSIDRQVDEARLAFENLAKVGIDMEQVAEDLEFEGVKSFADAFTSLLDSLQARMQDFQS
ncbi:MAG: transaldolase [Chloroflexota bacterium]|nr:MAG: transaldolase [Chloroflexota bacterium]HDD60931.1 transaldolase [Chloroflexota bacterium]